MNADGGPSECGMGSLFRPHPCPLPQERGCCARPPRKPKRGGGRCARPPRRAETHGPRKGNGMEKCSPMFAYVRLCSLNARKMFEASNGERGSILQNARQTEMGTRGTRPSEYQRQRLARTKLDSGRARWLRRNAERMSGKAKGLSDCNT